jgi:hypothetical protein
MRRIVLCATTVAVVCCVGSQLRAAEKTPEGTGAAVHSAKVSTVIPDDVTEFFRQSSENRAVQAHLSAPIRMEAPIKPAANHNPLPFVWRIERPHPTSSELPLVPLPPSAWTGAAGLAGLGLVRFIHALRKSLS